jgi:predicted metal-dependent hydrolase
MGPLILLKQPIAETPHALIVHELCHVWQDQDHRLRMWWSYVAQGYADNPHEVEAREAAAAAQ